MRIHCLQHVPFEGPARIAHWAERRGHPLAVSHLYAGDPPPDLDSFDLLVVMGGPMGVADEAEHSWLGHEKVRIEAAIAAGKSVVGICLGAQLIAEVLGAQVIRNPVKEIGWFPIQLTEAGLATPLLDGLPAAAEVFHWHGDTFTLPPGAMHLARSAQCEQQAFLFDERVLGLQFHLESTPESVAAICAQCAHEITPATTIQTAAEMRGVDADTYSAINLMLETLLDRLPD
ncbi:MAG: type 1 glutamine amidotransferase [Thiohalocapsa sp.]